VRERERESARERGGGGESGECFVVGGGGGLRCGVVKPLRSQTEFDLLFINAHT